MNNGGASQYNSSKKQMAINLFFSILSFVLNLFIHFFITPYITEQFGAAAYGFVKLSVDFTNYASILSIALNSMASRFLMIERTRGNHQEAGKYFSSIVLANIVLSAILVVPSVICVYYLERFLSIPAALVVEVKITFAVTFLSFIANLLFSMFGNCYYLTNKLSFHSIQSALMTTLRVTSILALFSLSTPKLQYVAIGSLIATVFSIIYNFIYTKKLTPELRFRIGDFDLKKLWEVFTSGVWNSITKLSQILSDGLDLLITNLMINPLMMGYLSIAKAVPALVVSFNSTISNIFSPNLMVLYAQNDIRGLEKATKTAMKFMCTFVSIPTAILITMGKPFFDLWVPQQPTQMISILCVITIINSCVTGPMQPLYQIFTITNKVRENSIVMIIYGFSSILVTTLCLHFTDWSVYAVASVSMIGSLFVAFFYHLPFAAKHLDLPMYTFFTPIGTSVLSLTILCVIGIAVKYLLYTHSSWLLWFVCAFLTAGIGFCINVMLVLNKQERHQLFKKLLKKKHE